LELRDFIVTPIVIFLVYAGAYWIRPYVTDELNRRYFIPALTVRIFGALAVGFIYQFYYDGGDTFAYHTHGSRVIWEAFMDSPANGVNAFLSNGTYGPGLWAAAERIWFWRDPSSFFIVRISAFFDLFTFSSYSATAVLFSVLAFTGAWMFYLVFYKIRPEAYRILAVCCLFIPSTIFWGSGIFKDSVTLAFVGVSTYCVYKIVIEKKYNLSILVLLVLSFYIIFTVKKYILISFIAGVVAWLFSKQYFNTRSVALRVLVIPLLLYLYFSVSYFSISKVMEEDSKYSIDKIAKTSMITAYDIRYGWGAREGIGSGYSLGELDGTWQSMLSLAPGGINVALFRPYLWEVRNPLMLLSALESLITLFFTLYVLFGVGLKFPRYLKSEVIFCFVFVLIFAFGVGISSYNFGTLSRYKIPLLPYYFSALALIYSQWKVDRRLIVKE